MTLARAHPRPAVATTIAAVVALGLALSGCSGGANAVEVEAPLRVADDLAPPVVGGGTLRLIENDDEATLDKFANPGEHTLVADGRLWEMRRAERLIGSLQITTVLPRVDFRRRSNRENVVRQIIPGTLTRIRIDNIEVYTSQVSDKAVFLWFGEGIFEVLQVKDRELEGKQADIAAEVIRHQATVPAWKPLPRDLDDEDEDDEH